MAFDPKHPDRREPPWDQRLAERTIINDAIEGTSRIRAKAGTYLPPTPKEDLDRYQERVARAVHYGASERALESIVGLIDRHEPSLVKEVPDWLPDLIKRDSKRGLAHSTSLVSRRATIDGMALVWLVPAWRIVKLDDVLDLVTDDDDLITEFRVRVDAETVWRAVLVSETMAAKTIWRQREGKWIPEVNEFPIPGPGLPLVYASVRASEDPEPPKPPLTDLAYENILHTQMRADRNEQIKVSGIPITIIKGNLIGETQQGKTARHEGLPRAARPPCGSAAMATPRSSRSRAHRSGRPGKRSSTSSSGWRRSPSPSSTASSRVQRVPSRAASTNDSRRAPAGP